MHILILTCLKSKRYILLVLVDESQLKLGDLGRMHVYIRNFNKIRIQRDQIYRRSWRHENSNLLSLVTRAVYPQYHLKDFSPK